MSKAISFIIPVYNVEKYLRECVDSILCQLTDECEIILVDDGATDSSGSICDSYATMNSKVKAVHQENGGLAAARNTGLDYAGGEYIAFVDSDDYLAFDCVSEILRWISSGGADVCFMRAMKVFPDEKQRLLDDEMDAKQLRMGKENAIKYLSERSKYPGSPCTKIFKRALIEKYNLRFPDDRRVSEDLGFVLQCILGAESYDALQVDYYYYRQAREGSITNSVTYKSFLGLKIRFPKGMLYEDLAVFYDVIAKSNGIAYTSLPLYKYFNRAESIMRQPFKIQQMDEIAIIDHEMKKLEFTRPDLHDMIQARKLYSYLLVLSRILSAEDKIKYASRRIICVPKVLKQVNSK